MFIRLNNTGVAHHLLFPVFIISLIAAAGAYVVTKSNAATEGVSCTIKNVPNKIKYGESLKPKVAVTNKTAQPLSGLNFFGKVNPDRGPSTSLSTANFDVPVGKTVTQPIEQQFKISIATSSKAKKGVVKMSNSLTSCSKEFKIN